MNTYYIYTLNVHSMPYAFKFVATLAHPVGCVCDDGGVCVDCLCPYPRESELSQLLDQKAYLEELNRKLE